MRELMLRIRREWIGVYRGLFMKRLALWPLRRAMKWFSRKFVRDPQLVAFGATRNRFADNPAYVFLRMASGREVHAVWITGSRQLVEKLRAAGYEACFRWSWRGVRTALRAAVYVHGSASLSDVSSWFSEGAVTVNLWHGVGVKRIQRDRPPPWNQIYAAREGSLTARIFAEDRRAPDWFATTSPAMTEYFMRVIGVARERCLELGYPRTDHLINGSAPPQILIDPPTWRRLEEASLVVGYFPTWRYDSLSAIPDGAPRLEDIARVVGEQGGVILFKPHPAAVTPHADNTSSLVLLPPDADLNAHLGLCDVLITDYSSVAADFLLLDRPIIIFAPDFEEDVAKDRFSLDALTYQPGLLVQTTERLFEMLSDVRSIPRGSNFSELRQFYWGECRGNATELFEELLVAHARTLSPGTATAGRAS